MKKGTSGEVVDGKIDSGNKRGSSGLRLYHTLNRARQWKWRELWKWGFMQETGGKEKLRICEICYRIDRKADRKEGCKEEHNRRGTMEVKEIYYMKSVADMVDYFESIWKEDPGRSNYALELPSMGLKRRRKGKSK